MDFDIYFEPTGPDNAKVHFAIVATDGVTAAELVEGSMSNFTKPAFKDYVLHIITMQMRLHQNT